MSIEFERGDLPELGRMEMTCDVLECKVMEYFDGDFRECIQQAKSNGWGVVKLDCNDWGHYCPDHNRGSKP